MIKCPWKFPPLSSCGHLASFTVLCLLSTDILSISVALAPTNLMAVREGPTGIRVSWTPPTPLGDTTGYRIYYSGGSSGSVDVSGGSTDNHLLTDLQNGTSYTISIAGTSEHLPSDHVDYPNSITLSELFNTCCYIYTSHMVSVHTLSATPPGQPSVTVGSTTATAISLSWTVPSGSLVDSYEVMWERDGTRSSDTITDISTSYTIAGLEEDSSYTITVTASNAAGIAVSYPVIVVTEKLGEYILCAIVVLVVLHL